MTGLVLGRSRNPSPDKSRHQGCYYRRRQEHLIVQFSEKFVLKLQHTRPIPFRIGLIPLFLLKNIVYCMDIH
ncbi:hypothetical protein PoB_007013500 [Plakobranchus ocellatus]|uniref:Uncharacterized protein n=1 Tax=Plakobranchus ocellatus TaxID=259542 RepID=A0AAV4DHM2_9GAST|nr:hypothetical protein PoB_007013500 [Plakobranchus ocellatus]